MMNEILSVFTWKRTLITTSILLVLLSVLSFYGLYTDTFYFFKFDNYIFPTLAIAHLLYLYVLWFKIELKERADIQMRNLEYLIYAFLPIYLYRLYDTVSILTSYKNFEEYVIPSTFFPVGILMIFMYFILIVLTLLSFYYRKALIGGYSIDEMTQPIDPE